MYATSFDVEGFKVWKSDNLKEWECLGVCLDLRDSWAFQDFWAPEVIFHDGKYIMHYTARQKSDESLKIGVAVSKRPEGPFKDVYGGPMFECDCAALDGHVFIDEDGEKYFYYSIDRFEKAKRWENRFSEVCVCRLSDDCLSLVGNTKILFGPSETYESMDFENQMWNEAPYMLKKDKTYYLTYSANYYATKEYCICLAKAENPCGPFEKQEEAIVTYKQVNEDFSGPGHCAFFKDNKGNLMVAFHIHADADAPSEKRKACICRAEVKADTIVFELL